MSRGGPFLRACVLASAFMEGLCVLVVEIAGARAVAPFFGTSVRVWTSQITATLLFLALGYALGGRLSRKAAPTDAPDAGAAAVRPGAAYPPFSFPVVLWIAGTWLGLFPWIRVAVLSLCAPAGVALGSFLASAALFGPALLCLGGVSPLLIQCLERHSGRGGQAAGSIFFTNTLGGLCGGWITALLLIPHVPLRLALLGTGLALALLGSLWAWPLKRAAVALGLPLLLLISMLVCPSPALTCEMSGAHGVILYSHPSGVGLIQVMDIQTDGYSRGDVLLVDGINQGGVDRASGLTAFEFTEYLSYLSWRYHPRARRALLLGLGTGLLAKQLRARGMRVDVAEIEPRMADVAREYFGMPADVDVHVEDARAFLERSRETWDVVYLDAFAGEVSPWYVLTREGLREIRSHLAPGGRLLVNMVTRPAGSPGLDRVEAGLLDVFGEARVYVDAPQNPEAGDLVNACLVAGGNLTSDPAPYPGKAVDWVRTRALAIEKRGRPARAGGFICTDDWSDLDEAEAELRLQWRKAVLGQVGPQVLGD
jgi:spermidine synthase